MGAARVDRRLAAILAADVVGYSRLIERDEAGTLERLKQHRKGFIEPLVAEHHGRIVKLMGDGALCEFGSVVDAVPAPSPSSRAWPSARRTRRGSAHPLPHRHQSRRRDPRGRRPLRRWRQHRRAPGGPGGARRHPDLRHRLRPARGQAAVVPRLCRRAAGQEHRAVGADLPGRSRGLAAGTGDRGRALQDLGRR